MSMVASVLTPVSIEKPLPILFEAGANLEAPYLIATAFCKSVSGPKLHPTSENRINGTRG